MCRSNLEFDRVSCQNCGSLLYRSKVKKRIKNTTGFHNEYITDKFCDSYLAFKQYVEIECTCGFKNEILWMVTPMFTSSHEKKREKLFYCVPTLKQVHYHKS